MGNEFSFRKSFLYAKVEYIHWLMRPKMCILLILCVFIARMIVMPVSGASLEMGKRFSVLEPFIALGTSGTVMLILPLCYMVLMAGYPEFRTGGWYYIGRIGRLNWLVGQLLFGIGSVTSFVLFLAVFTVGISSFHAEWSFQWSDFCTKYTLVYPDRAGDFVSSLFPKNLYNQMSLGKAVLHTYLLLMLYLFLILLILMLGNLFKQRVSGVFLAGGIISAGTALCSIRSGAMWLFPMAHSVIWLHYTEYFRQKVFSVRASYILFGMAIALLILLSVIKIFTYQFDTQET